MDKIDQDLHTTAGQLQTLSEQRRGAVLETEELPGFESLISDLLARFLNELDDLDSEIEDAIRGIVEFLGLDQGILVQWWKDETRPHLTHSWTVPGGVQVSASPGIVVVPWVHQHSLLGDIVMFSRVNDLPDEAEQDKEFFRRVGTKALISLPLKIEGGVIGVLVFTSLHVELTWPEDVVRRLQLIANVFAGVLDRNKRKLELEERLRFETLVSDFSSRFVNVPVGQIDGEIEAALKQVMDFFQGDRCELLRLRTDHKIAWVTHASYGEGIEHVSADINLAALFPWSYESLVEQERHVSVSSLTGLPPEADRDRQSWASMGVQSSLTIPLFFEGKVAFVISIDAMRQERSWPEEYIPRLRLLGEIFVNALERKRRSREIDERLRFEKLLSDLSAAFVSVASSEVEEEIRQWLQRLAEFFDADRCSFGEFSEDGKRLMISYSYSPEGISPAPDYIPEDQLPYFIGQLRLGIPFVMSEHNDLLPEWESERRYVLEKDIKSLMAYPVVSGGRALGMCALTAFRKQRRWDNELVQRLRLVTEVFANALSRKRTEVALRTSEEKFREFFEHTPEYCYLISPEATILEVNTAALQALGYQREELLGEPLAMIYAPESLVKMQHLFSQWKECGQIRNEEMTIIARNGDRRIVLLNVGSVRGKDGTVIHSTSVQTDITERKKMEKQLQAAATEWMKTFDTIQDMIMILDRDFRIVQVNASAAAFFGLPQKQVIGTPCYVFMHGTCRPVPECPCNKMMITKTHEETDLYDEKRGKWLQVAVDPILDEEGKVIGAVHTGRDITEHKKAEEALRQREAALINSQKDLRRLAGILISAREEELRRLSRELHDDLTQRLAVLAIEAGKVELEMNKMPRSVPSLLRKIGQIKEHLIKVSQDVHHISRQLHPSILDDLGLARAIESECAALLRRDNLKVSFVKGTDLPAIPRDVALCLYRVIQESLKNITKHSHAGSAEILLNCTDGCICLTIKDSGVGFDPLEVRLKPGLGLASMRERVLLVNGDVSIESQPGWGTVISVRVPMAWSCEE